MTAFFQLGLGLLPLDAQKDPTSRLKGWSLLGGDIERLRRDHGAGMVLTDRYAITGELAFYGGGPDGVAQVNERIRYVNLPRPDNSKNSKARPLCLSCEGMAPRLRCVLFRRFPQDRDVDAGSRISSA